MRVREPRLFIKLIVFLCILLAGSVILTSDRAGQNIGNPIDSYNGVDVYENGLPIEKCHGSHFSQDGYYYGERWQCVEFVKRYYYEALGHRMPDTKGHARDFFDNSVASGKKNYQRDLIQFCNGDETIPQVDDLLVFTDTEFGHVAIVSQVGNNSIEIVQQNAPDQTRQELPLVIINGCCWVGKDKPPAGWLRKGD